MSSAGELSIESPRVYDVRVLVPFLGGGTARAYSGPCVLATDSQKLTLTKRKTMRKGHPLSAPWQDVAVLEDLLTRKRLVRLLIGDTEIKIKVRRADVAQVGRELERARARMEKRRAAIAALLQRLPDISPRRARRLEGTFALWSVLLTLWLFPGCIFVVSRFYSASEYHQAIENLRAASGPFATVKPEYTEFVRRISPHLDALRRLGVYFFLEAISYALAWLSFPVTRQLFLRRQKQGPQWLLIALAALLVVHIVGALLSIPIPREDAMRLADIDVIRGMPLVISAFMLILVPLFGKGARVFYQWVAYDRGCFKKNGVGVRLLKQRRGD